MDLSPDEVRLIEKHRKKHRPLPTWEPRTTSHYSRDEKCDAFDRLHSMALDHFNQVKIERRSDEDDKQYIFEAVMELLGPDVWVAYNQFLK